MVSSRKFARTLHEDAVYRVLGAGNFPAHLMICDFRALRLKELLALFVQAVTLPFKCGRLKPGTTSLDGAKIKANASRHKAMRDERLQRAEVEIKAQIDALLRPRNPAPGPIAYPHPSPLPHAGEGVFAQGRGQTACRADS